MSVRFGVLLLELLSVAVSASASSAYLRHDILITIYLYPVDDLVEGG